MAASRRIFAFFIMMFELPKNNISRLVPRFLAILILGSVVPQAFAQYGVAPSQTGLFFDDLRARAASKKQQDGVREGQGSYNYTNDGYSGTATTDGTSDAAALMQEATEQIGRPRAATGYSMYSQRQAGDLTQYSGPYPSSTTFFAPPYTSDSQLGGHRNLHFGGLNFGFGMSTLLEYDDNLNRAYFDGPTTVNGTEYQGKTSDFIASQYLNISANYQLTENSSLSFSSAIGVDHYFEHSDTLAPGGKEYVFNVLPGSSIALDGKIGPAYVVLYDRVSVRPATPTNSALNSSSVFGVFQNDAGLAVEYPISPEMNLSVNYLRSDAMAQEKRDEVFDRSMDSIHASLAYSPTGIWTLGVEGGISFITYPNRNLTNNGSFPGGLNNDGTMSTAGVFFVTPVTRSTSIRVSGGAQSFEFDAVPTARTELLKQKGEDLEDSPSLSSYYYNVTVSNRLTSRLSQAINFGHESALNTTSNYVSADYVSYGLGIIAWEGSRLAISTYYEDAKESGGTRSDRPVFDGREKQSLEQYGIDLYLTHQLTSRFRVGFGYHYGIADSNLDGGDYNQQSFSFDLNFALTRKLAVSLGYRFFQTNGDDDLNGVPQSYDQNRIIMALNYNF
ncbi:MAG: hypothetical protein JWO89_2246 [Verrucomicrobiaceae bacterium]|nr:hypothetical protein [Verrucomicrobiaceae bacterium]